jgi:starch-binding outer membrane protein, SusD/RagB family
MKNKKLKIYLSLLCLGMLLGCSKDFLDIKPQALVNEESFYLSKDAADQLIIGAYSIMSTLEDFDTRYYLACGSLASDDAECGGENANDWQDGQNTDRMISGPNDRIFTEIWGIFYKGIDRANVLIQKMPTIKKVQDIDTALLSKRLGEAKFLRAYYYFCLTQVFGSVAVFEEPLNPSQYKQRNLPMKKAYKLIEADLLAAIQLLPERDLDGWERGRATKGAAKALLAKLYLFESSYAVNYPGDERFEEMSERWDLVIQYAEEVINSGQYKLMGIDGMKYKTYWGDSTNGYRYIFTAAGNNSPEGIFEVQHKEDKRGWLNSRGNTITVFTTVRSYIYQGDIINSLGWGFNCPTDDFISECDTLDPRFKINVAKKGDTIQVKVGAGRTARNAWVPMEFHMSPTGYTNRKYEAGVAEYWGVRTNYNESPLNIRILRYADVYLMAAEAYLQERNNVMATNYINIVRERARMCGNTGHPLPAPAGSATMDTLIHERRIELAFEGLRFFDLVRWNLAVKKLDEVHLKSGFDIYYESPKNDFFPIPASEITMSGNLLKQNPGY